uniref:Uncharacterized protein n=1 Tax=Coccolithus braarudii TaxID=221442 RepID=A0A7S0L1P5_9EUKA
MGKPKLIQYAVEKLVEAGFDTIEFSRHADGGFDLFDPAHSCSDDERSTSSRQGRAHFGVYLHEILALRDFDQHRCPPHRQLRRGWPPTYISRCKCMAQSTEIVRCVDRG